MWKKKLSHHYHAVIVQRNIFRWKIARHCRNTSRRTIAHPPAHRPLWTRQQETTRNWKCSNYRWRAPCWPPRAERPRDCWRPIAVCTLPRQRVWRKVSAPAAFCVSVDVRANLCVCVCFFTFPVQANKVGNKLIIEGAYVPSPRKDYLIENKSECCPLCSLDLNLKHTVIFDATLIFFFLTAWLENAFVIGRVDSESVLTTRRVYDASTSYWSLCDPAENCVQISVNGPQSW